MAENSKIEWCDHTFNPWVGCQKVSSGCKNCYAESLMTRKPRWSNCWGPPVLTERLKTSDAYWKRALKWNREAKEKGIRYKVFCASLADVFEDNKDLIPWRDELWHLINITTHLDWLILTKRPENIKRLWPWGWFNEMFSFQNIWLGVTVENQAQVKRLDYISNIPAMVKFISVEPQLEKIDLELRNWAIDRKYWIIAGGESGRSCRPFDPEWARLIKQDCEIAGIPFFMKQLGGYPDKRDDIRQFPHDLRVREFPNV